jgi:DNA-binding NarL/FixJ family response regulator
MTGPLTVLLADDHALVRAGIRSLLASMPGIVVVAEAENGREALRLIEEYHPNLVLMDIAMPEMNGLEAIAEMARTYTQTRVIILSMHANAEYVLQALHSGASGYLLKDSAPAELEIAVRAVLRGETYLSPPISHHVVADYLRRVGAQSEAEAHAQSGPFTDLTPRQREVLQLIAEGYTNQAIASKLTVSVKTVETHRSQLMDRLDVHDVAGLVRYAVRHGLVSSD